MLAAAAALFEERGWNGTAMRDVAKAAQVSVETIYAGFGSKTELFRQALDVRRRRRYGAGPSRRIASEFRRLNDGTEADRAEAAAQVLIAVRLRTARLRRVLNQAASGEPQLQDVLASHSYERAGVGPPRSRRRRRVAMSPTRTSTCCSRC